MVLLPEPRFISEGIDTGDIIAQKQIAVHLDDTGKTLYHLVLNMQVQNCSRKHGHFLCGHIHPISQCSTEGTYHKIRDVDIIDEIDMNRTFTAGELINILRARTFPPHRGAYIVDNQKRIYVNIQLSEEHETMSER